MTNLTKLTALALAALVTGTTMASALPFSLAKGTSHHNYTVECRVSGDNFYIANWGSKTIDSGTQIAWYSPSTGDDGVNLVPKMLNPGDEVQLAVLSEPAGKGALCTAGIL